MASTTVQAALRQAVKASAAARDLVRRPAPGIVVLIYHRVGGGSPLDVDLPVERFDEQMAWLAATGKRRDASRLRSTRSRHAGAR